MGIQLLNMDCMDYMAGLPDKAFDLAIVDPPYGIGIDGQKETTNKLRNPKQNRKAHMVKGWDSEIPSGDYFSELQRVSSNQIIWGANYFIQHLSMAKKGWIFWFKGQEGLTMSDGELAYSSFDKPTRQVTLNRVELLKDGTIHPTQKPVKLYEWLLTNYANPGQRILDTHLGSGSSAIAAHNLGFDFVGTELDQDYYEAALARFNKHISQGSLFEAAPPIKPQSMELEL
jgi:site-specific DNA-methyltransferase (adenine-specific)